MSDLNGLEAPTYRRPSDESLGRWIESGIIFDDGGEFSAELIGGRIWTVGFEFDLILRSGSTTEIDVAALTAYYTTPWKEPPVDAFRVDVSYGRPDDSVVPEFAPLVTTNGTAGRITNGYPWIQSNFWVSPLPRPVDNVRITVRLDSVNLKWLTTWLGSTFSVHHID